MFVAKENSSLGPGSALGEKREKIRRGAKKKIRRAKRAERLSEEATAGHRSACFARRYFSHLTPFFSFFPLRSLQEATISWLQFHQEDASVVSPRLENSSTCTQGWK